MISQANRRPGHAACLSTIRSKPFAPYSLFKNLALLLYYTWPCNKLQSEIDANWLCLGLFSFDSEGPNIFIILCLYWSCVHFGLTEIGFVLQNLSDATLRSGASLRSTRFPRAGIRSRFRLRLAPPRRVLHRRPCADSVSA